VKHRGPADRPTTRGREYGPSSSSVSPPTPSTTLLESLAETRLDHSPVGCCGFALTATRKRPPSARGRTAVVSGSGVGRGDGTEPLGPPAKSSTARGVRVPARGLRYLDTRRDVPGAMTLVDARERRRHRRSRRGSAAPRRTSPLLVSRVPRHPDAPTIKVRARRERAAVCRSAAEAGPRRPVSAVQARLPEISAPRPAGVSSATAIGDRRQSSSRDATSARPSRLTPRWKVFLTSPTRLPRRDPPGGRSRERGPTSPAPPSRNLACDADTPLDFGPSRPSPLDDGRRQRTTIRPPHARYTPRRDRRAGRHPSWR